MRPHRLLAIAALALASGAACAYEIIESRYRVEVAPGKFQDQLVLKCDNGRTVTVPWEAKLYEACGEDLMGRPVKNSNPEEVAQDRQKEVMMSRVREQYGNIDERYVQFQSGPAGVSMQFQGPIRDVLKRYEICRKQTKNSPTCVSERDQALAALGEKGGAPSPVPAEPSPAVAGKPEPKAVADAKPASEPKAVADAKPASEPKAVAEAKPSAKPRKTASKAKPAPPAAVLAEPAGDEGGVPVKQVTEAAPPQPGAKPAPLAVTPAAEAPVAAPVVVAAPGSVSTTPAEGQAAAVPAVAPMSPEQKIAEDYAWCMRAKPKFECEQARAKARSALNKPKPAKPAPSKGKSVKEAGPLKAVYSETVGE